MLNVTDSTFKNEILEAQGVILVDFWAPWCGPCRMVAPILEEMAEELNGKARIAKVNVDENPELASNYGINSIPTMLIFKDGKPVEGIVGALPKKTLTDKLSKWLS